MKLPTFKFSGDKDEEDFFDELDELCPIFERWFDEFDGVWSSDPMVPAVATLPDSFVRANYWSVTATANVLDIRMVFNEFRTDEEQFYVTFIGRSPEFGSVDPEFAMDLFDCHFGPFPHFWSFERSNLVRFLCSLSQEVATGLDRILTSVRNVRHELGGARLADDFNGHLPRLVLANLRGITDNLASTIYASEIGEMVGGLLLAEARSSACEPTFLDLTRLVSQMVVELGPCLSDEVDLAVAMTVHAAAFSVREVADVVAALTEER
jgi:hypothetical protein